MSNILTDYRRALIARLEANLPRGPWDVRGGERDGAIGVKDRKLAVVFVPTITAASNILFSSPPMIIRAWLPKSKQPRPVVPTDPEPLEQLAVDLMTTLQPVSTSLLPGRLYFWVNTIEIDEVDWGIQATLTSFTGNPAVNGA